MMAVKVKLPCPVCRKPIGWLQPHLCRMHPEANENYLAGYTRIQRGWPIPTHPKQEGR